MSQLDAFNRAVVALCEAMLDETLWPNAAGRIEEACGSTGCSLVVGKDFSDEVAVLSASFCRGGKRSPGGGELYFSDYHANDERLPRLRRLPDSQVVPVAQLFTAEERKTSAVYNEVLRWGDAQKGLNMRLDGPRGSRIVFNLYDPVDSTGWGSVRVETLKELLPHIRHFVNVRWELAKADALNTALANLCSNRKIGVIHLDRFACVREMNDYAHHIINRADGLSIHDGFLRAALQSEHARLEWLLERVLAPAGEPGLGGSMTVSRAHSQHPLTLRVSPVGGEPVAFGSSPTIALVLLSEPADQQALPGGLPAPGI